MTRSESWPDRYRVFCKKHGWVAVYTHSRERAQLWIEQFNPNHYADKTLCVGDFEIQERAAA